MYSILHHDVFRAGYTLFVASLGSVCFSKVLTSHLISYLRSGMEELQASRRYRLDGSWWKFDGSLFSMGFGGGGEGMDGV